MTIVYIVMKNMDQTEGRGPMVINKVFVTKQKMIDYLNTIKFGIFGYEPPPGKTFAEMVLGPSIEHGGWVGYSVFEVEAE